MPFDIFMLFVSLCLILACCAIFVNAIECFGKALDLHQGIIGSIFAAVGTALPETMIPIIAIIFTKGEGAHAVGIGAIAGAPFMLATLAFFVTGVAVIIYTILGKRTFAMKVNSSIMSKDLLFFLIIYSIAITTSFFHQFIWLKICVGILLFLSYFIYLRLIINDNAEELENVETLYLTKYIRLPENIPTIIAQISVALIFIVLGAHLFIVHVQSLSNVIGISPLILSLIITPIATEMPEKLNSIIWIGRKKDTLAIGNITGAMVFQSCIPVVFGMIFTPWKLRGMILVSAALALASGFIVLLWLKIKKNLNPFILLCGGLFYVIFLFHAFVIFK
jgi:cation:H+ antiporter